MYHFGWYSELAFASGLLTKLMIILKGKVLLGGPLSHFRLLL